MPTQDPIVLALRDLVGAIFRSCSGAYGAEHYEGQFEREIQALAALMRQPQEAHAPPTDASVTGCTDCPHRYDHRGNGECWAECGHATHGRPAYGNILWGCQEPPKPPPSWCPLGLSDSPYMTAEQLAQLDRLLGKALDDNVRTWVATRINGASSAMSDRPNLSPRLLAAFDRVAERVRGSQATGVDPRGRDAGGES